MPQTTRRGQSVCSPLGLGVRSDTSPLPFLCCEDSGDSSFDGTFAGAGYGTFAGGIFAVAGEGDGLGWDLDFGIDAGTHAGGRLAFAGAAAAIHIHVHTLWAAVVIIYVFTASYISLRTTEELRSFRHVC